MLTAEQIEARRKGIGGSDASAVCGIDPYRQPLDVWLEKVEGIRDETVSSKEAVRWGNLLEDTVAREWAERSGVAIRRANTAMVHPDLNWMLANIDRRVTGSSQGLEVKTRGHFAAGDYGPSGTDQVKDSDIMQCQHYMGVTGWGVWHMAVLIGGQELRSYSIPRDQGLIDDLIDVEESFWSSVQSRERPAMIYEHRSCDSLLRRLYPGTNGETLVLPQKAVGIRREMADLAEIKRSAEKRTKALSAEVKDMIGESAVGLLPGSGGGWRRKLVERSGYEVVASEYFDVRFSGKLGDK